MELWIKRIPLNPGNADELPPWGIKKKILPSGAARGNQTPRGHCNYQQTGPDASSKVCLFVHLLVSQRWREQPQDSRVATLLAFDSVTPKLFSSG